MAHSNSFPTLITVSQQMNQAHFQQSVLSQMQPTAVVNSQIVFPQCPQPLSIQHQQNGSMATVTQVNNANGNGKAQMQHTHSFTGQGQQQLQQHPQLTIPLQLGSGNHAFTTTGIPLDLSYLVQGGCLPHCVPIQLTGPNGLQPSFQAALSCVSAPSPSQAEPGANNSFLQFANVSLSYPQCHQQQQPQQQHQQQQTITQPSAAPIKTPAKRRKKPITTKVEKAVTDRFQSVAVQTDFDMSLCRQQIVVVPPKNCTCGAVAKAVALGSFQAASFPPRKTEKKNKRSKMELDHEDHENHQQQQQQEQQQQQSQQNPLEEQCNGTVLQPSCDNRGRPFTYECLYCPKKFSLHSRLVAHLRCHTGMRPFSCLQCGYSFTQRSYLNRHAAVHKQERPFTCVSCHKTYKHYGSLANHRKLHAKDSSELSANISEPTEASVVAPASIACCSSLATATSQLYSQSSVARFHLPPSSSSTAATAAHTITSSSSSNPSIATAAAASSLTNNTLAATATAAPLPQHYPSNHSIPYPMTIGGQGPPQQQQLFQGQQTLAAFYPGGQDGQGFLLSLNPSSASSTLASNTMLLQLHPPPHPTHQYSTTSSTLPSSSATSAYVPLMSSPAFS